jgi:hypothetical protein
METQTKRKINKVTYLVIFGILLVWIIVAISTCGGGNKEPHKATYTEAYIISQHFVEARLKSPSTADFPTFPDAYKIVNDSVFVIQGHVDSQNSFGAMIRTNYITTLSYKGGDWADWNNWTEVTFNTTN